MFRTPPWRSIPSAPGLEANQVWFILAAAPSFARLAGQLYAGVFSRLLPGDVR